MPKLIMLVLSLLAVGLLVKTYLRPTKGEAPTVVLQKVQNEVVNLEKQGVVRAQVMQQQAERQGE